MITNPPIDKLVEKAGNKYILCCAVSKRAKELIEAQNRDEISSKEKTISYAAVEFANGETKLV